MGACCSSKTAASATEPVAAAAVPNRQPVILGAASAGKGSFTKNRGEDERRDIRLEIEADPEGEIAVTAREIKEAIVANRKLECRACADVDSLNAFLSSYPTDDSSHLFADAVRAARQSQMHGFKVENLAVAEMRLKEFMQAALNRADPDSNVPFRLSVNAARLGWTDLEGLQHVEMPDEKLNISDRPGVKETFQQLFSQCRNPLVDKKKGWRVLEVEQVIQVFQETTRMSYMLRRQELAAKIQQEGGLKEIQPVQTQRVPLANALGYTSEAVDANLNEFYLFHGTSKKSAFSIVSGDFRLGDVVNGNKFGKGVYASEWSNHSQLFQIIAHTENLGDDGEDEERVHMLVCRAFCGKIQQAGNFAKGFPDFAKPDKDMLEQNIEDGKFMSTRGSEFKTFNYELKDYVLPDVDQILPEFLVICKKVPRDTFH